MKFGRTRMIYFHLENMTFIDFYINEIYLFDKSNTIYSIYYAIYNNNQIKL